MAKRYNLIDVDEMKYWNKRAEIRDKKYVRDVKALEKKVKQEYVKAKKEIKKEIDAYYLNNPEGLTEYQSQLLEDTLRAIDRELDRLFQSEENLLTEAFIEKYKNTYKDVSAELGVSFSDIPTTFVKEVIAQNWSGLTYSERIWENHRRKLATAIKESLKAGLIRGDSIQDISRIIQKKFNISQNDANRLIRTEMTWVMNQATINNYKDNDIKEYQFLAMIDKRTSDLCKSRDGEVVSVEEAKAGSNLPPLR